MAWIILPGYRPDTSKPVEPVSAASPFNVSKVLGSSIPIVIGTGKVAGLPVIGGAETTRVITGYDQYPHSSDGALAAGGSGFDGALDSYPPGSKWTTGDAFSPTVDVPVYGTQQSAQLGYLLAFDPFGDGYELIRVEINDEVVYDAENGVGASENFRFDGGTQTAVDPITKSILGTKAGAWQRFAMIFLSGYVTDSAPTVKCVISNASTATPGDVELAWITDDVDSLASDGAGGGILSAAYDIADGIIYQILTANQAPGLTQAWLSALDVQTHVEIYRVPLADSDIYADGIPNALAMRGSGYVLVRLAVGSETTSPTRIYNASTGAIVAEWREASDQTIDWRCSMQVDGKYVFVGVNFDGSNWVDSFYAVADIAQATLSVSSDATFDIGMVVRGRTLAGSISFFVVGSAPGELGLVHELIFDGDQWTRTLAYTSAGTVYGIQFDPKTGYLIASVDEGGGTHRIAYVNPDTATLVDSFTGAQSYSGDGALNAYGYERYWAKPGFALFQRIGTNAVYLLNIDAKTFSLYATIPESDSFRVPSGIYDQNRQAWFYGRNDDVWTEHKLPNTIPGAMALEDIITKAMSLCKYTPEELTFDGFTGLSAYGLVIDADTNIRTVLQSGADIYGYSFTDTGSGFYFKKPGRDDAFALDAVLTTSDLVFGDSSDIESTDEASIRSVSRVELDYRSKEQGYDSRPASFQMPAINNSIRVAKYSSPWVLTDLDAKTFVTQKFFELQARLRDHTYSLVGQQKLLPGDVVSVPSGSITYAVQIESVDLNRDMSVDIQASDFQTSVQTTITPVTNVGFGNTVPATLQSQYIHLDIPLFRYADDLGGTGLRQYGVVASRGQAGWGGGVLYRGDTSAALTPLLSQAPHNGVIGVCVDVLNGPVDAFGTSDASTVTIRRTSGDTSLLIDKTEDQVLAGANLAFIGAAGRWEGVGYKTAVDNGDGTFTLSGFTIRGYRGTEVFAYDHQVGDRFVMIDASWLKSVTHPLTDLEESKFYKAIGLTQNPATGTVVPHSIIGAAETPYAPVNLVAGIGSPDGIDLSWDYRSRLATGLNPANHGEAYLRFEVDILDTDGVTVLRTLGQSPSFITTNAVHYASADVVTDFGADPPTELFFNVYMMSAVVGRGYAGRGHKFFSGIGEPMGLLLALTKA
jgi:hypothetical protein